MCAAATSASGASVSSISDGAPEPSASVNRPSPEQPIRCSPATAATTRVRTSTDATRAASTPSPNPACHAYAPPSRRSRPSSAPSASRNRTSAPGPSGRRSSSGAATEFRVPARTPPSCATSTPSPSAARSPSSGATVYGGKTVALPPPSVRATAAFGPSTATRCSEPPVSGSRFPALRASTNEAAAASRSNAETTGASGAGGSPGAAAPAARAPSPSTRSTFASTADSGTRPARTASTSAGPHGPPGPGISRSIPARAGASVSHAAHQSDITSPSKPHSSFSTSASSGLADIVTPSTRL